MRPKRSSQLSYTPEGEDRVARSSVALTSPGHDLGAAPGPRAGVEDRARP
jgi:hypothetical protein